MYLFAVLMVVGIIVGMIVVLSRICDKWDKYEDFID